jgi:CubicO group peptidase (beta-lactamase class C family)
MHRRIAWSRTRRIRYMVASLVAACLAASFAPNSADAAAKIDKTTIDAALSGIIQSKALVGVSALVYQDGHEAYFGAFGQADRKPASP